ncbi:MAG: RidA family protein [Geminicoccaceae bacterium]
MNVVATKQAPAAIGPYSQGIIINGLLFTSGQIPLDPATGKLVEGSIGDRARRCLDNLAAIAQAAGTSLDKAVKVTVFLTDIGDFKQVNEVYGSVFKEPYPARSAIQVAALPMGADVEIEAVLAV